MQEEKKLQHIKFFSDADEYSFRVRLKKKNKLEKD